MKRTLSLWAILLCLSGCLASDANNATIDQGNQVVDTSKTLAVESNNQLQDADRDLNRSRNHRTRKYGRKFKRSRMAAASSYTSSYCGAPTRKGGFCSRRVSGGGRCWQHS